MQYKTIVLELLKHHPKIYRKLAKKRMLLLTVELCAGGLKANHEEWKERLSKDSQETDSNQIANQALEFALKELETSLGLSTPPIDSEKLTTEGAMAFIRRHTPTA